jgi:GNAT superfamily N-acetyltransferase
MKNKSKLDSHAFNNLREEESILTKEQALTRTMVGGIYKVLGIQPKELCMRYPADNIEGVYNGKYYYYKQNTEHRIYINTIHPDLVISFYIEDNVIFIYNIIVAKHLQGNDIGSRVLSAFKLAGMFNNMDVALRAQPVSLYETMKVNATRSNGSKLFMKYKDGLKRHTDRLINFYEKNEFVLTGKGLGPEMVFKITDTHRKETALIKNNLKLND